MTTLLIGPADKTVTITVQQRTRTAPQDAFHILAPIDLPTVFRPVAPFPGISSVKNQTEAWDHAGPRRNPQFDDGSQADEELTEYVPGSSFAYQLTGFTNVLSHLAALHPGRVQRQPRWRRHAHPLDLRVQAAARPPLDPRRPLHPALAPLHGGRPRPLRPRHRNKGQQHPDAAPGQVTARSSGTRVLTRSLRSS